MSLSIPRNARTHQEQLQAPARDAALWHTRQCLVFTYHLVVGAGHLVHPFEDAAEIASIHLGRLLVRDWYGSQTIIKSGLLEFVKERRVEDAGGQDENVSTRGPNANRVLHPNRTPRGSGKVRENILDLAIGSPITRSITRRVLQEERTPVKRTNWEKKPGEIGHGEGEILKRRKEAMEKRQKLCTYVFFMPERLQ